MSETLGLEQVSWEIAHTLEDLVVEVGDLRKLVMWQECLQWEQLVQGAVVTDMVELIGHGDLRMWEMGASEKPEEELPIKKVRSRKSTKKWKGKEQEKALEVRPESGPEEDSEVEGQ